MSNEHKSCFQSNTIRKKQKKNKQTNKQSRYLPADRPVLGKTVLSVLLKTERRVFSNKDLSAGKQHIYLTSAQADMALYAGLRFPPFVEWFAETKTAGESL